MAQVLSQISDGKDQNKYFQTLHVAVRIFAYKGPNLGKRHVKVIFIMPIPNPIIKTQGHIVSSHNI